jgi:hypothetical protein
VPAVARTFRSVAFRVAAWSIVIGLLVAGGLWYVGTYYEWVEEKVRFGMKGEALENPYLASELLLVELDLPVRRISDTRELLNLPLNSTLFLPSPQVLDDDQTQRLARWVENGGHLVILAGNASEVAELLGLHVVGYRMLEANKDGVTPVTFGENTLSADVRYTALLETDKPVLWRLPVHGGQVRWNSDDDHELDDRASRLEPLVLGDAVLHVAHGAGFATALGTMGMFNNHSIGRHRHAELLVRLLSLAGERAIVIAPDPRFPNLVTWLWERAAFGLIILGLLLAGWLWRSMPRFGPVEPVMPPARPGLREHLTAVGEFHLKGRDFSALLNPLREECLRVLRRHAVHHGYAGSPLVLAQRYSGLPQAEIDRAFQNSVSDRTEFLRCSVTIARVRDALANSHSSTIGSQQ